METNTNLSYEQTIDLLAGLFINYYAQYGTKIVQLPLTIRPLGIKRDMSSSTEQMLQILLSSSGNEIPSACLDKSWQFRKGSAK